MDDPSKAEGSEEERLEVFRGVCDEIELTLRDWLAHQSGSRGTHIGAPLPLRKALCVTELSYLRDTPKVPAIA